jgi:hypothetical protein
MPARPRRRRQQGSWALAIQIRRTVVPKHLKSTAKALFVLAGGLLLGILYAALGAFTFSLNNVVMRRGVMTGSVLQGMALIMPIGAVSFVVMTAAFGALDYRG